MNRAAGRALSSAHFVCYSSATMAFSRRAGRSYGSRQAFRRRLVFVGLWGLLISLVIGLGVAAGVFVGFLRDLPSLDGLEGYQPSITTTLYTDQGEPFASFYEQRRILLPLAKIPLQLKQAVLAVEDSRFYEHRGLSPRAIARAMIMNVLSRRKSQGGSTITQQLARVLFLTPEKSFTRKIKEALLAVEIEKHYSKDKILELYFNQVYFGHGAYGVEAAAQTYFKKSVAELNLAETAMLAGLPSAPNRFSPILEPGRARRRRDHVLNRMVEMKFITRAQAVRRCGSAALDLCYVACGRFDGFWETGLHPWDSAAGSLIVREARGMVTKFDGTFYTPYDKEVLATNSLIHKQMMSVLR